MSARTRPRYRAGSVAREVKAVLDVTSVDEGNMADYWNHNVHYQPLILAAVPLDCGSALDVGCGDGTRSAPARCDCSPGPSTAVTSCGAIPSCGASPPDPAHRRLMYAGVPSAGSIARARPIFSLLPGIPAMARTWRLQAMLTGMQAMAQTRSC